LGQKEQALEWLEKAYDERSDLLVYLKVDPIFDSRLRSEPRFGKLLQRMGLADKAAERDQAINSVAILPLVNVTGDPKAEALCDTIAEEVSSGHVSGSSQVLEGRPSNSRIARIYLWTDRQSLGSREGSE